MAHQLIVITGASGTGKTTVSTYLHTHYQVARVITHTTRPMRAGETNGVDYYFETPTSFAQNHYIEHVTYAGYSYGSSYEALDRAFAQSNYASIVLDTAGAISYVQQLDPKPAALFLTLEQPHVLKQRLLNRGDEPAMITQRLQSDEYRRDLTLPPALAGVATVVTNDKWPEAKRAIDQFFQQLQVKQEAEQGR